jgi:chromosome segregation ATPase
MKRALVILFCMLVSSFCWADKAQDIANVKAQIAALENETPAMLDRVSDLKKEKENQIDFVGQAYDKQEAQYEQQVAAHNQKDAEVAHQLAIYKPSEDNYNERVAAHNARSCTEKCYNGQCDGSCAWYTAEKNQLDANKAELEREYAPIRQAVQELQQDSTYLQETHEKLETIRTGLNDEIANFKAKVAQLQADWDAHTQKMAQLQAQLAALYGSVNDCLRDIPAECQQPAYGPDGKPILNQNCEDMKAQCSKMFDGNK